MHQIYLLFCSGQIIRNLDRICQLAKRRCNFSEYSISSPTKRIFYPNQPLPKKCSFFLCKNAHITRRICTQQRFAPKIMLMTRNRRWIFSSTRIHRPQTASISSSAASCAHATLVPRPHTVCSPSGPRLHVARRA